ncbi:TonB-dependent receptor plug domain-containing protein [Melittangium boletus]|uniref:TonB-dependent receptor plug domain-containing protein n=1 Tax=Melittangium boletus TaxID=83453 RepID=UPI003DA20AFD
MKFSLSRSPSFLLLAFVLLVLARPVLAQDSSLLHSPPTEAKAGEALVLDGVLSGSQRITRVVLRYRGSGEPYTEVPMELEYGDLYRGSIPASSMAAPGVEYYMEGFTAGGERVPLFKSATRPARVNIAGEASARTPAVVQAPEPPPPPPSRPSRSSRSGRGERNKPEPVAEPTPPPAPPPARVAEPPRRSSDDDMAALTAELPPGDDVPAPRASPSTRRPLEPAAPVASEHSQMEEDLALYSAEDTLALATRQEQSVKKVPAIAASFGREQIRSLGARTVADVLDVVPGVTISRDVQGSYRTAIRGLRNDAEVLFLLNGHRLNSFFDGKALMNLPVENLERIEVIRGPGSSLYGAGAFLGVVNLVTQRTEGVTSAISAGGFPKEGGGLSPTLDGHLSGAYKLERLEFFGDADVWYQQGDSMAVREDALDTETVDLGLRDPLDPAGYTKDDRFLVNVGVGGRLNLSSDRHLTASARLMSENRSALLGLFDTVGPDSRLKWLVLLGDLTYEQDVSEGVHVRARLYGDRQSTDRLFQISPRDFATGSDPATQLFAQGLLEQTLVTVSTLGASLDSDLTLFEGNRLTLGAVAELQSIDDYSYQTNYTADSRLRDRLTAPEGLTNILDLAEGAAARRLTFGVFAQDQWTVVEPLTLTLGVRVDATQLPSVDSNNVITGTQLVPSVNPRVGLVFSATDSLVLKLLYGRAFRPPTMQELLEKIPNTYYNQGRYEGNPTLQPAVVNTLEAGVDLIRTSGESRVRLRANAFFESFSSPIAAVDTTGNIVPVRNRDLGVNVYGVEGEARLEASRRATAWVNASLFRAEDLELPTTQRYLTDTPQARFNAGLSMPIGDLVNFDLVVRTGAERRNNTRSILELIRRYNIPAYSTITAQVRSEPIADHFELALVIQNAFDSDQRDDVPRPDRVPGLLPREGVSAFLTLRAHN